MPKGLQGFQKGDLNISRNPENGRTLCKSCHKFRHSRINKLKKII